MAKLRFTRYELEEMPVGTALVAFKPVRGEWATVCVKQPPTKDGRCPWLEFQPRGGFCIHTGMIEDYNMLAMEMQTFTHILLPPEATP